MLTSLEVHVQEHPRHPLVAHGVAVMATAASLLVRWPLWPVLGNAVPQMTFFPAVTIAAYFGGFWPGVLATVLSAFAANYFIAQQPSGFHFSHVNDVAALILFVLVGTIVSGLCESLHRVRRHLVAEERRRAEEALRETEERFQQLAENIHEMFWIRDARDDRMLYVSPSYGAIWDLAGKGVDEQIHTWIAQVHPDDRDSANQRMEEQRQGIATDTEFRLVAPDGSIRWVRSRAFPMKDEQGKVSRIAGLAEDITDRKRAEEALRAGEARFRALFDQSTDAIFLAGAADDGRIPNPAGARFLDVNPKACESLGYTREELIGMCPADIDADMKPAVLKELGVRLAAGEVASFDTRHRRKDGSIFPVEVRLRPVMLDGRHHALSLVRDLTERKRIEDALRQSEERFRGTFENAAVGIAHVDFEGRWLRVNQRLCDIVGHTREELLQRMVDEITHADDLSVSHEQFTRLKRGEIASYSLEKRYVRKDGAPIWAELFVSLQQGAAGEPAYSIAVLQDISPRKRLEEELRESEHRWRSLTEALPQLVWSAKPDGGCDYFSTQWTQHTGVPESQLLGWSWLEVLHPDDREPTRRIWTESVTGRGAYDVEYRVRRSDGEYRWFKTRGVPIRDGEGNIFKWFGTCTDITDAKLIEEALRESEERFRNYFELSLTPMAITAPGKNWVRVNERLCELLGYRVEELQVRTWAELTHPDDLAADVAQFERMLRGEIDGYSLEKRFLHRDNKVVHTLLSIRAVRRSDGAVEYCLAQLLDITALKQIERELRQAKEAAEAANRAKDEFLANVSHEIRTPMNAILGMTELVLDTPLSGDQRQSLRTVKSAADNLLGIINDLLDFSKIEAGKLELDPGEFCLRTTVSDTLRALAVRAHRKGLELVCNVRPEVPDALVGDAGRLRQVLLNLVGNAIKFTAEGEVVVEVDAADQSANDGSVNLRFTVRDTGIGIPREKQSTIFRAFEQEDTSTTRKYGGTGLGLTISARLVALMGGSIAVESDPGRGSRFSFIARFGRQAHESAATARRLPGSLHHLRVLVVDDNAVNRHIMEQWLRDWQMEPTSVGDGMAAMDALWHGVNVRRPYALVLLDARMPDTDGLTLAAKIRERAELSGSRIILLTSGDRPGDSARFRELRVDAHLLKPVQQDELLDAVYSTMSLSTEDDRVTRWQGDKATGDSALPAITSSPSRLVTPSSAKPLRILVAEDNEFNAQLMEKLLVKGGHTVRVVGNGREALALANAADFDLLLLDVHMPELDGFQVIQSIRQREQATGLHLPVIALTARSRQEDRDLCIAAGMDDFLTKPIQMDGLWAVIDRVADSASAPPDRLPSRLIDPRVLLAACGGDADILKMICDTLRARLPDHLALVQDAFRAQDAPRLREAAHKLCGMISAFSTTAGAVASELEDHAARGQLEEAGKLVEQLDAMASELPRLAWNLSIESLQRAAGNGDDRNRS
jgi:PAS domain S-box-containing protein